MQFSKSFILAALPFLVAAVPHPYISARQDAPANGDQLLTSISSAPLGFLNSNDNSSKSTFLFNNPHYWALQRYVYDGFNLPSSNDAFGNIYSQADFEKALPQDQGLFGSVQDTFVGINNHCGNFWNTTVGQMTYFADTISILARNAVAQYTIMQKNVEIMANSPDCTTAQYKNSMISFYQSLSAMNKSSEHAFSMCSDLHQQLVSFEGLTIQDQSNLAGISSRLNASNPEIASRIADINTDIDNLRKDAQAAQALMDKAQHDIDVGPAYAWIWPIGTITYLVLRSEWIKEKNAANAQRQTDLKAITEDQQELAVIVDVNQAIFDLEAQVNDIRQYIGPAIQLIAEAEASFANMSAAIDDIIVQVDNEMEASDYTIKNAFFFSTEVFSTQLQASIQDWQILQTQAAAYQSQGRITVAQGDDAGAALYNTVGQTIIAQLGPVPTANGTTV